MKYRHFYFLVLIFIGLNYSLQAQTDLDDSGTLVTRYNPIINNSSSTVYEDFTIPTNPENGYITFQIRGGDGGKAKAGANCESEGGDGAVVDFTVVIGDGAGEIPEGTTIRFIPGMHGNDRSVGGSTFTYTDGGGGSGVLAQLPNYTGSDGVIGTDDWVIIAVAGGGGGAFQGNVFGGCIDSQKGQGGRATTSGGDGGGPSCCAGSGGTNGGNGEDGGGQDGKGQGGFGYLSFSVTGSTTPGSGRGHGYGPGGSQNSADESACGGGGYSGGGGGAGANNGGGGGSYAHPEFAQNSVITAGGASGSTDEGFVAYQFECITSLDDEDPVASCGAVTIDLADGTPQSVSAADFDDGSTDNCSNQLTFTFSNGASSRTYDCDDIGLQSLTIVITDEAGNTTNCSASLTITDSSAPTLTCIGSTTVVLNETITAESLVSTSSDDCPLTFTFEGGATSKTYDCGLVGTSLETIYATDPAGNSASCEVSVTLTAPNNFPETTWVGTESSDWSEYCNWTNGVPGPDTDVTIQGSTTYDPVINSSVSIKSLVVESGALLTINYTHALGISGASNIGIEVDGELVNNGNLYVYQTNGVGLLIREDAIVNSTSRLYVGAFVSNSIGTVGIVVSTGATLNINDSGSDGSPRLYVGNTGNNGINCEGTINIAGNVTLSVGRFTSDIPITGDGLFVAGGILNNDAGEILINNADRGLYSTGTINNLNDGIFDIGRLGASFTRNAINNSGTFNNTSGLVKLSNAGFPELFNAGTWDNGSGTLQVEGRVFNLFSATGTIAPGLSTGTMTTQAGFNLSNATLEIEVEGTTPDTEHDVFAITGNATLGGTLSPAISYPPTIGDRIVFLTYTGTRTGIFSVSLPALWSIDYDVDGEVALVYELENPVETLCGKTGNNNPFDGIDAGADVSPQLVDGDGDDDLDLIIGRDDGTIYYYQNDGSGNYTQQTGSNNPFNGVLVDDYAAPQLVDVDSDNDLDLIVGSFDGTIYYYQNDGSGNYTQQTGSNNPFNGIDVGGYSSPQLIDVDSDDDLDLIIGERNGTIFYYQNDGNDNYTQQTGSNNPFDGIDVGDYSTPQLVYVDEDAFLDLIVGEEDGIINYYQNDGGGNYIEQTGITNPFDGIDVGRFSTPQLVNVDGDGDLDLISGATDGTVYYYQNIDFTASSSIDNCVMNSGEVEITISSSETTGIYDVSGDFTGSIGSAGVMGGMSTIATGISVAGTYNVTITSSEGCTLPLEVMMDEDCAIIPPDLCTDDDDVLVDYSITDTQTLSAGDTLTANALIASTADVTLTAANTVLLQEGFEVENGASFHAYIATCTFNNLQPNIEERSEDVLKQPKVLRLQIAPNPVVDYTNIKLYVPEAGTIQLRLIDLNGRLVHEHQLTTDHAGVQQLQFEVGNLPNGMYFLQLRSQKQQVVEQLIVQK